MGSIQIVQESQPPTSTSIILIENIEVSIENLIKSWKRRQKLQLFFNSTQEQEQEQERAPWRAHLTSFFESTPLRVIAILLLLTDLLLTVLELSSSLLWYCTAPKKHGIEQVWYHWVGIAILSLLCVKTMALALGLGSSFFRRPGYVIDGVVLMVALILEAFLEKKGGGLLVVVSLWRVVRVVETAFELSDEAIQAQIEGIVCQLDALKEENTRLLLTIDEKDKIIQSLQQELDKFIIQRT